MSRAGMTQAVRAAASSSPLGDSAMCQTAVVRLFGVTAGVAYTLDPIETARRDLVGLGPLIRCDLLDVLMALPVGLPVSAHDLSAREQQHLRRAPGGALDHDGSYLIRRAVHPAATRLAVVAARSWREGLVRTGRFAPFCARAMLLPAPPADLDEALVQASFYGIGIYTFAGGKLQMLVEPELHVRVRHTAVQWWFSEEIYRQVIESGSAAG